MGIPRFYRYISERYPLINQPISDVSLLPTFDCFYLDMNGIIHNCTHTDSIDSEMSTLTLSAQLHNIFTYMDHLITHIIKPQQILYIAIDGVAPRAKLNQQRSRRFRAGLDRVLALEQAHHRQITLDETEKTGFKPASRFDSNSITPGTAFLTQLSQHLIWFIRYKLKHDPLWQQLQVFFSGSEVPGEGEHKIVDFIRHRKMMKGYKPNTRHCMYGSDADLMLLGLMTHEPHFTLVREVVKWGNTGNTTLSIKKIEEEQWQLVHLSVLREYLMMEMRVLSPLDGEKMINDFIFLTFLLGNDFIPHSPTLEINEDAIPLLLRVYRECLEEYNGQYLTLDGEIVNIELLQSIFLKIGAMEEEILMTRAEEEKQRQKKKKHKHQELVEVEDEEVKNALDLLNDEEEEGMPPLLSDEEEEDDSIGVSDEEIQLLKAVEGKDVIEEVLAREEDEHEVLSGSDSFQATKWSYYERKFGINKGTGPNKELNQVKQHYIEALVWVLEYYFQGPPCWGWYYPYHYSPMISDLTDIVSIFSSISFLSNQGPLLPFEQLMANLPSSSAHLVPESYRFLMQSPLSPIINYYPIQFPIDMEGKRNTWEGINLLPFINVEILQQAIAQYCPNERLTVEERERNKLQPYALRIVYDTLVYDTFPSTMPGHAAFPEIVSCHSRMAPYVIPSPPPVFQSRLMDGVTLPMAGFPSLYTLEIESVRIQPVQLNCFGMSSRKSTFILQLPSKQNEIEGLIPLIGTTVLVNWPHLHQAQVLGVSTLSGEYRSTTSVVFNKYDSTQSTEWMRYTQSECMRLLSGRGEIGSGGIDIGNKGISYLLHVVPLQGMIRDPMTGAVQKKFGTNEARVPIQLAVVNRTLEDPRFQEIGPVPLTERFPIGSTALITAGRWVGCTGRVVGSVEEKAVEIQVYTMEQEPPFGYVIAQQLVDVYYPSYTVASRLGISTTVLGMLCGSIVLKPNEYDIGLNLRYRKELYLPGYIRLVSKTRAKVEKINVWEQGDIVKIIGSNTPSPVRSSSANGGGSMWECSDRTITLIAAYQQQFPEVVRRLETVIYAKGYPAHEVLNTKDAKEIETKSLAVVAWIEAQQIGKIDHARHIPVSSVHLSVAAMRAIEAAGSFRAKEYEKSRVESSTSPTIATVPPYELFRPNPLVNQDLTGMEVAKRATKNTSNPLLGDRVINISARGVPFGHRGTVVATHVSSKCVEVLFDQGFTGGEPLYGSKSLDRGKLVPWNQLLCVSTPDGGRPSTTKGRQGQTTRGGRGTSRTQPSQPSPKAAVSSEGFVVSGNHRQHHRKQQPPAPTPVPVPVTAEPSVPQALPAPPDPEKINMLLKKWCGKSSGNEKPTVGDEESNVSPSVAAFFSTTATAPASVEEGPMTPSVAALFNSAAVSTPSGSSYTPPLPPQLLPVVNPLDGLFPHLSDLQIQTPPPPPPPQSLMTPFGRMPPPPPAPTMLNPNANMYTPPSASLTHFPPLGEANQVNSSKKKQIIVTGQEKGSGPKTVKTKYLKSETSTTPKAEKSSIPKKKLLMPSQIMRGVKPTSQ